MHSFVVNGSAGHRCGRGVFHSSKQEVFDNHLVIFFPRIGVANVLLKEVHDVDGLFEGAFPVLVVGLVHPHAHRNPMAFEWMFVVIAHH